MVEQFCENPRKRSVVTAFTPFISQTPTFKLTFSYAIPIVSLDNISIQNNSVFTIYDAHIYNSLYFFTLGFIEHI